jgi:Ca-activated chloride channel family protein
MAVGPRYIPGVPVIVEGQDPQGSGTSPDTDRVPDASRITPPIHPPEDGAINPLSLSLSLNPGFPLAKVESPFHPIISIQDQDGGYQISLREDAVPADRDFHSSGIRRRAPNRWPPSLPNRKTARPMPC